MTPEIRDIALTDIPMATSIWNEIIRAGNAFPQTNELTKREAIAFFADQSRTAVAICDGAVCGLYILHPNNIGRCSGVANASYAVAPDMRGQGIGRALVCDSIATAGAMGFTGLQFNAVVDSNAGARHLYEELGFEHIGMIPQGFLNGDGVLEDMHIYYHPCNMADEGQVLDVAEVVALEKKIANAARVSRSEAVARAGRKIPQSRRFPRGGSSRVIRGATLYRLMNRAGRALADVTVEHLRKIGLKPSDDNVVILSGAGNNGGDGWVAARLLAQTGICVSLVTPCEASELRAQPAARAAALTDYYAVKNEGRLAIYVKPDCEALEGLLESADVVIDAMLGTGFSHSEVREPLARWIDAVNCERERRAGSRRPLYVIAADVPSGMSAKTGEAATPCMRADETFTMLACKPGLLAAAAVAHVGRVTVANLKPW